MYISLSLLCLTVAILVSRASIISMSPCPGCDELPNGPRHILDLSPEEKRSFLESFDHVFSDVDGVVWNVEAEIPGATEGFKALRQAGKALTFITNNSVRSTQELLNSFAKDNLEVDANDVVHPAISVAAYLKNIKFEGLIYIIASDNFKSVLREAGFRLMDGPNELAENTYPAFAHAVFGPDPEPVRAVVIDMDMNLSYMKLVKASLYLRDPNCLFIAGATDMLLPLNQTVSIVGPGPFINMVAESSDRTPAVLGKPGAELAGYIKEHYNIENPKRALMVGDVLEQDIGFGKVCGFQTLAVLSGVSTLADIQAERNPQLIPDYYADSMGDFLEFMDDLN